MLEKLEGSDRELVVAALQALLRERITARDVVGTACCMAGKPTPQDDVFGLNEASTALRRIGAAPSA
jgi:hypothetical protein